MSDKTQNQKAWLFVLPVVLLVAFNAIIPLMAVVNYAVQETFGNNIFFFEGLKWFEAGAALGRASTTRCCASSLFTGIILRHRGPARRHRSRWPCRARASGCRSAWC